MKDKGSMREGSLTNPVKIQMWSSGNRQGVFKMFAWYCTPTAPLYELVMMNMSFSIRNYIHCVELYSCILCHL